MKSDIKSILIEEYRTIFTVFSKNACTSMKAHIVKSLGLPQSIIYPEDIHGPWVYDYPTIEDEELVSTYHSYLRYCIVRNPWSRLFSCFKNKIKAPDENNYLYENGVNINFAKLSKDFKSGMSFSNFVDLICAIPDSKADRHFRSQLYDMVTSTGKLRVNYVAKLENLNKHLEEIHQLTGMVFDDFPRLNKTSKKQSYTDYYTPDLIEKVRERYKGDIELFKYKFGEEDEFNLGSIDNVKEKKILESSFYLQVQSEKIKEMELKMQKPSSNSGKIFCIGLNKTGTRSINTALNMMKLRAAHHHVPSGRIGEIFKYNLENNEKILSGLENYVAYSDWIDMEGTNNDFFKIMDQQYPGSKFIYTDRNLESWIESRIKHIKKIDRLESYQKMYPDSIWYNMNTDAWREEYRNHKQDVLDYFKDREKDLLIFNVFEGDDWKELCSFLQAPIPSRQFPVKGKSTYTKKAFIQLHFLKRNIFLQKQKAIFYFLPGGGNLHIKASLISYLERKKKFEFPNNSDLVNNFHFPAFMKDISHPSFKNQFRFTIVRNPWDRLAACYHEMICSEELPERFFKVDIEESFNEFGKLFSRSMPFEEFVEKVCAMPDSKANRHFSSQIYQLTTSTGELLVNYIGYYERLKETSSDIYEHTQMSLHEVPLSKERIDDTSYTHLYTEELQKKVQNKFADDIALFGYKFGVPLEKRKVDFVSDEFLSQFRTMERYIDILREKNKELNHQLANTSKELNQFKEQLSRKEYELDVSRAGGKLSYYKKDFEEIQGSLSWKITAPLRYIGGVLTRVSSKK